MRYMKMARCVWCLGLVATVLAMTAVAADEADEAAERYSFGPHPRLRYDNPELFPAAGEIDAAVVARLRKQADAILERGIEVPTEQGDWIFYYACREHNSTLRLNEAGEHECPQCKKTYATPQVLGAYTTKLNNAIEGQLLTLGKAYHATKDGRYAAEVIRVLGVYASLYPGWGRHDRWGRKGMLAVIGGRRFCQSLDEAVSGIKLAKAYDLVVTWPDLPPETRITIERDCFGEIVETIYALYPLYSSKNNHMTWYNAGVATIAAVLGNRQWLDQAIDGSKGLNYQLNASVTADGLWYEGTVSYHFYAVQAVIETVDAAAAVGRDLDGDPRLKRLFTFPLNLAYPNGQLPAYNDGDFARISGYRNYYKWATLHWDDPGLAAFAETGQVEALPSAVFAASGYAYLRRGTGDQALAVALDFGENGGHHGHPDKLQMVAYGLGRELFLDPGRLTYRCDEYETWTRQTIAHNTVALDRDSQRSTTGALLQFTTTDDWDAAVVESAAAYRGANLRRAAILFDDVLVDLFAVRCSSDRQVDWTLHGTIPLVVEPELAARAEPLAAGHGYQHLADLRQGARSGVLIADWRVDKATVRSHVALDRETTVTTGTGIGYQLTQRLPFLMLSDRTDHIVFAVVHDLSGSGERISAVSREDGDDHIVLHFKRGDTPVVVSWKYTEKTDALTVR